MDSFLRRVDWLSEWSGKAVSWFSVALTLALTYEVIMRYAFNAPTVWAFDVSYMLGGTLFFAGAAYTLWSKGHVRIDILYLRFSPRGRALLDIIFTLIFFFPLWGILLVELIPYVYDSWASGERALESFWRPPIYPFKTVLPVGVALLLLQGIAEFIRSLNVAFKGKSS